MSLKTTEKIIRSEDRYLTEIDWLKSYHSFSFGEHYHPENKGWGNLRVINEDFIQASCGFDTHAHRDMEIVTYLISGELEHKDSQGNQGIIKSSELQSMSAGSGIMHSEYNPATDADTHLLQIWFMPAKKSIKPSYQTKEFKEEDKHNNLLLIVSADARDASIGINQNIDLYASIIDKDLNLAVSKEKGWLQLISGSLKVKEQVLNPGDALALDGTQDLKLEPLEKSHFLFFDLG